LDVDRVNYICQSAFAAKDAEQVAHTTMLEDMIKMLLNRNCIAVTNAIALGHTPKNLGLDRVLEAELEPD